MMNVLNKAIDRFTQLFKKGVSPTPGLHHYLREGEDGKVRLHLRIDADGSGLLIANANRVVHLNPSAALMAYLHLEGHTPEYAARVLRRQFKVSRLNVLQDIFEFTAQLEDLVNPNGGCPICELNLETTPPFKATPSAPYRMDLALTYRCNNDCHHCYNARARNYPELTVETWKKIIDQIWDLGIPHVVFTGGEPTLYQGLPELVAYAEEKGLITGLNTNGRKLADQSYLTKLVEAGLDHVQITIESHDPNIHNQMVVAKDAWSQTVAGIRNVLSTPLYVMTNTTLLTHNAPSIDATLIFLAQLGVPTVGLNALIYSGKGETVDTGLKETELPPLLESARQITQSHGQRLIWYTPTQYCHFNPLQLDLGIKGCTAALYNMCIESNGDVIPCQSYYQSLGNFLENTWQEIWEHPLAVQLRNRQDIPEGCRSCDFLPECGGGCPLARQHQSIHPIKYPLF
ncbi:MAG TPA: radical SAM protein [Brevefilum fermentans]|jgi:radical SAM protein with 4Fe4S-binding SPASM domain|nr:radical SAM protein [Brevefilum fermentans]HQA29599.1 radical SAM protein [Brevefilum fermentans]